MNGAGMLRGGATGALAEAPDVGADQAGIAGFDAPGRPVLPPAGETWAVVLAGGEGTRLRGFVRQVLGTDCPKQFCRIVGSRSMLRHTWDRAARVVDPRRIVTVITAGQERHLENEAERGVPGTVLIQPANKDTAPALVLALLWIARRDPAAFATVFPADHFIWMEERFARSVRTALAAAEYWPRRLTLLGVEPEGPETDYGWITPGAALALGASPELYAVQRFWEKPDHRMAGRLFSGGALWNTLVLAGRVRAYLDLAESCLPELAGPLHDAGPWLGTPGEPVALAEAYDKIPSSNLSRALLAKCPGSLMVLAARHVGWSDWGDPDRVVRTLHTYDRRPGWLPAYAGASAEQMAAAGGA